MGNTFEQLLRSEMRDYSHPRPIRFVENGCYDTDGIAWPSQAPFVVVQA
jgi:hypothetical protein